MQGGWYAYVLATNQCVITEKLKRTTKRIPGGNVTFVKHPCFLVKDDDLQMKRIARSLIQNGNRSCDSVKGSRYYQAFLQLPTSEILSFYFYFPVVNMLSCFVAVCLFCVIMFFWSRSWLWFSRSLISVDYVLIVLCNLFCVNLIKAWMKDAEVLFTLLTFLRVSSLFKFYMN